MGGVELLAALATGAALGSSGATLQGVLRNPLAEPYILGLAGGASLGVALVHLWAPDAMVAVLTPFAAFAGAAFSLALACAVGAFAARARGERGLSGGTVVVAGFVGGSFTCSLQMLALSYAEPVRAAAAMKWLWGDLRNAPAEALPWAAAVAGAAMAVLFANSRKLDALTLGDDAAESLGVDVRKVQLTALAAASAATAASVALAGAVGFLGLAVPHAARRLAGPGFRGLLPASAALGALALAAAHWAAGLFPGGLPVGVVCALAGAPFFLWLLAGGRAR